MDAAAALRQAPHMRQHYSVKNQMMRFLRRSKSAANPPTEKMTPKHSHNNGHHYRHNHVVHPQARVVNQVEGLPFVVGNKTKKVRIFYESTVLISSHVAS